MGHCRTCTCTGLHPGAQDPGRQGGRATATTDQVLAAFQREDTRLDQSVALMLRGVDPARGLEVAEVARNVHGRVGVTAAEVEVVRRRLESLRRTGVVKVVDPGARGGPGGSHPTRYGLTIYPDA